MQTFSVPCENDNGASIMRRPSRLKLHNGVSATPVCRLDTRPLYDIVQRLWGLSGHLVDIHDDHIQDNPCCWIDVTVILCIKVLGVEKRRAPVAGKRDVVGNLPEPRAEVPICNGLQSKQA